MPWGPRAEQGFTEWVLFFQSTLEHSLARYDDYLSRVSPRMLEKCPYLERLLEKE